MAAIHPGPNVGYCTRFKDALDHSPPDLARPIPGHTFIGSFTVKRCTERVCSNPGRHDQSVCSTSFVLRQSRYRQPSRLSLETDSFSRQSIMSALSSFTSCVNPGTLSRMVNFVNYVDRSMLNEFLINIRGSFRNDGSSESSSSKSHIVWKLIAHACKLELNKILRDYCACRDILILLERERE